MRFKKQSSNVQDFTQLKDNVPEVHISGRLRAPESHDRLTNAQHKQEYRRVFEEDDGDTSIDRGWAWMILIGSFTIWLATSSYHYFLLVLLVDLVEKYDTSIIVATTLLGVMHVLYCISTQICVHLWTNFESVRILSTTCSLIYSVSTLFIAFTPSLPILFITSIIKYTVIGGMCLPPMKLLGHYFDWYRSFAIGVSLLGISVASLLVPPLSRFLRSEFGFNGSFLILCGIELQAIPASLLMRPLKIPTKLQSQIKSQKSNWSLDLEQGQEYSKRTQHRVSKVTYKKLPSSNKNRSKDSTVLANFPKKSNGDDIETAATPQILVVKKEDWSTGRCPEFLNVATNILSKSKISVYDNISVGGNDLGIQRKVSPRENPPMPDLSSPQVQFPPKLVKVAKHKITKAPKPVVITVLLNDHQKLFSVTLHQRPKHEGSLKVNVDERDCATAHSLRSNDLNFHKDFSVHSLSTSQENFRTGSETGDLNTCVTSESLQRSVSDPSIDLLGRSNLVLPQNETKATLSPMGLQKSDSNLWWWSTYTAFSTWAQEYLNTSWWKTATEGADNSSIHANEGINVKDKQSRPIDLSHRFTDINTSSQGNVNKEQTSKVELKESLRGEDISKTKGYSTSSECNVNLAVERKSPSSQIAANTPRSIHSDTRSIRPLLDVSSDSDNYEAGSDNDTDGVSFRSKKYQSKHADSKIRKSSPDFYLSEKASSSTSVYKQNSSTRNISKDLTAKDKDKQISENWFEKCFGEINSTVNFSLLKNAVAVLLLVSYSLIYSGTFIDVFIVSFAMDQNVPPIKSAVLISMIAFTELIMKILYGYFVDLKMLRPSRIITFAAFLMVPVCFCASLYSSYGSLVVLAILHGAFGMVGKVLKAPLIGQLLGIEDLAKTMTLVSMVRGLVISIEFPLHGLLIVETGSYTASFYYIGTSIAVGATLLLLEPFAENLQRVIEEKSGEKPYRQRMVKYIRPPPSPVVKKHSISNLDLDSLYA